MGVAAQLDELIRDARPPAEKMREALALYEPGVAMQRLKLRRAMPSASDAAIEQRLQAWLARESDDEAG